MPALKKTALAFLFILVLAGLIFVTSCETTTEQEYFPSGGIGPGGMMGYGGMMGFDGTGGGMMGGGMMGPGFPAQGSGQRITVAQAADIAEAFATERGDLNIEVAEIMEFAYNFYVEFKEKNTGIGAVEALIDPFTGILYPEPGPNMMWNTKYGTMSGMMWGLPSADSPMTVTQQDARRMAGDFLDAFLPEGQAGEVERFYGYYTIHVLIDGQIFGMLSVNGYTGQVWYHHWHGEFLRMVEF